MIPRRPAPRRLWYLLSRSASDGFTLLEIMIALAIIAIAFVALLGLRNRDIVLHEYGRTLIAATALAQQRLADTLVGPYPEVGRTEGPFDEAHARFSWRQDVNPTPFDFVREVRVVVRWAEAQEDQVELVSYVFQRGRTTGG